jgi:hypothetical protein
LDFCKFQKRIEVRIFFRHPLERGRAEKNSTGNRIKEGWEKQENKKQNNNERKGK